MIQITTSDLKANLSKYLSLAAFEDIVITKNGTEIAVITVPDPKPSVVDELIGVIPNNGIDLKTLREERLSRYESND